MTYAHIHSCITPDTSNRRKGYIHFTSPSKQAIRKVQRPLKQKRVIAFKMNKKLKDIKQKKMMRVKKMNDGKKKN